jgi:ribosome biogenesis GTPase
MIGRVLRVDRGVATVLTEQGLTESGPVRASFGGAVLNQMAENGRATPCAGDWCVLRQWPDHRSTLESVLPRRTVLVWATADGPRGLTLWANVEYVAMVVALHPAPARTLLEKLRAVSEESGVQPLVVLSKADLVADAPMRAADVARCTPGVEVVCTSTRTGTGIARLLEIIDGRNTVALVGPSGHGKSSLTDALLGAAGLTSRRGRLQLTTLPAGGAVIDAVD